MGVLIIAIVLLIAVPALLLWIGKASANLGRKKNGLIGFPTDKSK